MQIQAATKTTKISEEGTQDQKPISKSLILLIDKLGALGASIKTFNKDGGTGSVKGIKRNAKAVSVDSLERHLEARSKSAFKRLRQILKAIAEDNNNTVKAFKKRLVCIDNVVKQLQRPQSR